MLRKKSIKIAGIALAVVVLWPSSIAAQSDKSLVAFKPSAQSVAQSLLWKPYLDPSKHLCSGYFYYDPAMAEVANPMTIGHGATTVSSQGPSVLMPNGKSVLHDHVVFTQKGRKVTADKANVYRDNHTGKITRVELFGHVHDFTADSLVVCPHANINLLDHQGDFTHAIVRHHYNSLQDGMVTGWSTATKVHRHKNGDTAMRKHVQFSLCSPLHPSWIIHAAKSYYNKAKGELKVHQGYLTFHHIPLFYSPYFTISMRNDRKSGFLTPKLGYSSTDGYHIGMRYYFNLAPNYDDLLTNGYYSKRGYYVKNKFRWLTPNSNGIIKFYGLPHDNAFASFKNKSLAAWNTTSPYYQALKKDGLKRYSIDADANFNFEHNWSAMLQLHHVSDDYFLQDFSNIVTDGLIEPDQLYNVGSLNYNGEYQQFGVSASGYQTLHPYAEGPMNQYAELGVNDNWFVPVKRVSVSLQTDVSNFLMPNDVFTNPVGINKIVNGSRMHARANVIIPWMFSAGFVKAEFAGDFLADHLFYENPVVKSPKPAGVTPKEVSRALPIVNIGSGVYFINPNVFGSKHISSTIEPEISYLYIPYKNQQTLPLFDTTLLPLSYDTLYSSNQFLGIDRIQNANQINLGFKTTLTDSSTGAQLLSFGTGMQYYMTLPKVQGAYQQAAVYSQEHFSPWVNELTISPQSALSTTLDWNWNWYKHRTDSATATVSYVPTDHIKLSASYDYIAPTNINADDEEDGAANLYVLGIASPIGRHLEAFTYQYYDAQLGRMLAGVQGFQYDSCCWALRMAFSHQWDHTESNAAGNPDRQIYNNAVYVEFILKGLGNFGSSLESLLKTDFNGYNYR